MLSDNLDTVARRLHLAAKLDAPLTTDECATLARIMDVCAADAAALEEMRLCVTPAEAPSNVIPFPLHFRCVDGPGGAA